MLITERLHVSHLGQLVTLRPLGMVRVCDVFPTALFDPIVKLYVLRVADFPNVVQAALDNNVELVPEPDLGEFLRLQASRLESEQRFIDALPDKLYPFQLEGAAFLHNNPNAYLFDEMGLGKTVQALMAIPAGSPTVVVCPAALRLNWARETARWRPDLSPIVVQPGKNSFEWPKAGEVVIVSYGGIPRAYKPKNLPAEGTNLIADEAHLVKSYKAARTRAFRLMSRRVTKRNGFVWMMTGTPVLANPKELWGLLQAQELGGRLYRNWTAFEKQFGGYCDSLGVTTWNAGAVKDDALTPLRNYALRRKREAVLKDMPAKSRYSRVVELVTDSELAELLDSVDAEYGAVLTAAAEDAAASLEYFGGIDMLATARKALANAKIPALLAVVDEYAQAGEPVVVFSAHRGPIEHLAALPGWGGVHGGIRKQADRDASIADFQAGRLRGLACTIGAAGMGYTFTRAAHAIFVDQDWTPAMNLQAEDRLCRIGQKRPVSITVLEADHPLDAKLAKVLSVKLNMIDCTTEQLNDAGRAQDRTATAASLYRIASLIDGVS